MNFPDQISEDQLKELAENAQKESAPEPTSNLNERIQLLEQAAKDGLDFAFTKAKEPLVHKIMAMQITAMMYEYHVAMSAKLAENGDLEPAAAWMRDAGQWQVIHLILSNMQLDPNDFTCMHTR